MDDFEVFKNKTFQGLLEDIYNNTSERSVLVKTLIEDLRNLVETPEDAVMVIPMIVQYLDVGVKNDRHLVDLSNVIEKHKKNAVKSSMDSGNGSFISPEEEAYLLEQAEKELLKDLKSIEPPKNDIEE